MRPWCVQFFFFFNFILVFPLSFRSLYISDVWLRYKNAYCVSIHLALLLTVICRNEFAVFPDAPSIHSSTKSEFYQQIICSWVSPQRIYSTNVQISHINLRHEFWVSKPKTNEWIQNDAHTHKLSRKLNSPRVFFVVVVGFLFKSFIVLHRVSCPAIRKAKYTNFRAGLVV